MSSPAKEKNDMQPWVYFLISGALFFVMMRFGCGSHVMGHGHHHQTDNNRQTGAGVGLIGSGSAQVCDPVCGMSIDTSTAKTSVYHSVVNYFCSDECRTKFEASPATYTVPAA